MKKAGIIAAVMAVVMTLGLFAGCNRDTTPWQDEARTLVADKMDDTNVGKFVIDGVKYDFPMAVKDLTDNGWKFETDTMGSTHVSGYAWHPSYINLRNANNKTIEIAVYNESEEASTVAESTVGEVRVSNLRGNAMLSGGIDFYGTTFEANGDLGDHAADGFELVLDTVAGVGNVYTKEFKGSNGKNCTATFYFGDYNGSIVLKEVKYECAFKIPYTDAALGMILAVANNDPSKVEDLDSSMNGQEFIDDARKHLADDFVYSLGFDFDTLTDEQYQKVYKIMESIYSRINFTVQDKGYNTLIVFSAPANIADVLNSAIGAASDEYEGDLEDAPSDPEYLSLVLDNFNTDDLEYMPGSSVLVTNDKFSEGIYTVLYAMLGFDVD